jgi:hypothetical protein
MTDAHYLWVYVRLVIALEKSLLIFMKLGTTDMSRTVNLNDSRTEVVWKQYAIQFIL